MAEPRGKGMDLRAALTEVRDEVVQFTTLRLNEKMAEVADQALGPVGASEGHRYGTTKATVTLDDRTIVVTVPRNHFKDGKVKASDLLKEIRQEERQALLGLVEPGTSLREASRLAGGRKGSSPSNLHRLTQRQKLEQLEELMTRRYDPQEINDPAEVVLTSVDAVAVGGKRKKHSVLVATGVTRDGRKMPLGISRDRTESGEMAYRLLNGLVERGVSDRGLVIADFGAGIREALEEICQEAPLVQHCFWHKIENVQTALRKAGANEQTRKRIKLGMQNAYDTLDADVAREMLEGIGRELDKRFPTAARSLRYRLEDTLTVFKLGLPPELVVSIRTNNLNESINKLIRVETARIPNWSQATPENQMVEYQVASILMTAEREGRLSPIVENPTGLEQLAAMRLGDQGQGLKRPPHLVLESIGIPTGSDEDVREYVNRLLAGPPQPVGQEAMPTKPAVPAAWLGSDEALGRLGLARDLDVTEDALSAALRGRNLVTSRSIRRKGTVLRGELAERVRPTDQKVKGLAHLHFRLDAPTEVSEAWSKADATDRTKIEETMLVQAAQRALDTVASDPSEKSLGSLPATRASVAAVGTIRAEQVHADPVTRLGTGRTTPRLYVEGLVVGVDRGGAGLNTPSEIATDRPVRREAEAAAKAELEAVALSVIERQGQAKDLEPKTHDVKEVQMAEETQQGKPPTSQPALPGVDARPRAARQRQQRASEPAAEAEREAEPAGDARNSAEARGADNSVEQGQVTSSAPEAPAAETPAAEAPAAEAPVVEAPAAEAGTEERAPTQVEEIGQTSPGDGEPAQEFPQTGNGAGPADIERDASAIEPGSNERGSALAPPEIAATDAPQSDLQPRPAVRRPLRGDTLKQIQEVVGDDRALQVREMAQQQRGEFRGWSPEQIQTEFRSLGEPLEGVDIRRARRAPGAQRTRDAANWTLRRLRQDWRRQARRLSNAPDAEKAKIEQELEALTDKAGEARSRHDGADRFLAELRADGQHPDQLLMKNRQKWSRQVALEEELISQERAANRPAVLDALKSGEIEVADPLARHGHLMSARRFSEVSKGASDLARRERFDEHGDAWLWHEVRSNTGALGRLPENSARLDQELESARQVGGGEAEAGGTPSLDQQVKRRQLEGHSQLWNRIGNSVERWAAARRELTLRAAEQQLRAREAAQVRAQGQQQALQEMRSRAVEMTGPAAGREMI